MVGNQGFGGKFSLMKRFLMGCGGPLLGQGTTPVVASEVLVETLVGIYPQELADDLYGQDLGIRKFGRRA
jgi:hypothetical protein